ncbi:MAG: 50S ribosomal protein L35 [Dehalococcoidales bacterium]|jgi:large subunit ribosomal protein L35
MPKLKTHKGAKSRFHITGRGKVMRIKGPKSHLRRNKASRVKNLFDKKIELAPADRVRIKRLIPNGV